MLDSTALQTLLDAVSKGEVEPTEALDKLKHLDSEVVGDFARVDHHRSLRTGFPEVIWGHDKTPEQIVEIMKALTEANSEGVVMATRVSQEKAFRIQLKLKQAQYYPTARICALLPQPAEKKAKAAGKAAAKSTAAKTKKSSKGRQSARAAAMADAANTVVDEPLPMPPKRYPGAIAILTAGTADLPTAEEAAITAELCGFTVNRLWDVGVAGIHRLLENRAVLDQADVVIVAAGMEGALPSVVGGLVDCPVIALPTSIGYGASFGGVSALLGMLNSCAAGLGVVNIDNGFGAAILAGQILRTAARIANPKT